MNAENSIKAFDHAISQFPRESCGLVIMVGGVQEEYVPCRNMAETPVAHVVLSAEDYAAAEDRGEVVAMVHSHPNGPARPSAADLAACEASGIAYIILSVMGRDPADPQSRVRVVDSYTAIPSGYRAPLVGRPYSHGIHDCYTLIQDYYNWEMGGIILPDFDYPEQWWNKGLDLYMENFATQGFSPIEKLEQPGDIIFMQIRSKVVNHAGIYLGGDKFLQHAYNRMSTIDVYGGYWASVTRMFLRKMS